MSNPSKFSPEIHERAVRMVYEVRESPDSQWAAIEAVSSKIGCTAQILSNWIRKDSSPAKSSAPEDPRIKAMEREIRELKRANEILKVASAFFAQAELDRRLK
ncbi:transposase [Pseudomonas parafulva]|nr:transposase [Pseudomonas parafulva]